MQTKGKIALVQEPPVFLNLKASLKKACSVIEKAASMGADIIGFPECWAPGYPVWLDFAPQAALWDNAGAKQLFRLLGDNAVVVERNDLVDLQAVVDRCGSHVVFGTHERDGNTLYNTTFILSPGKAPLPHRKLVPTYTERLVWGRGDGSTLETRDTEFGTLGSLICWEHWMPLLRATMHASAETIHIAQWPAGNDVHQLASRHYAFEGRCYVGAAASFLSKGDVLAGFRSLGVEAGAALGILESIPGNDETLIHNGGSAVIAPDSTYVTSPLYNESGVVIGRFNLDTIKEARQTLDTNGHYSRPDIFDLTVNTKPQKGITLK